MKMKYLAVGMAVVLTVTMSVSAEKVSIVSKGRLEIDAKPDEPGTEIIIDSDDLNKLATAIDDLDNYVTNGKNSLASAILDYDKNGNAIKDKSGLGNTTPHIRTVNCWC